jgi:methionyl-tRNA formyltransferase
LTPRNPPSAPARRVVLFCNRSVGRAAAQAFLEPGPWVPVAIVVDDRGRTGSGPPSFGVAAGKRGVPVLREAAVNSSEALARIKALDADLFVVLGFSQILGEALLAIPPEGVLNLHTSLLPQYRGATPNYWMVREGATRAGVTAHWMAATLDSGPVVAQRESPVGPDETGKELETRLAGVAAQMMREVLSRPGPLPAGTPQNEAQATSHPPFRDPHAALDLGVPAASILAQVRAARGWIEPTVVADGSLRTVRSARFVDPAAPAAGAGPDRLVVERPDGTVELALGPPPSRRPSRARAPERPVSPNRGLARIARSLRRFLGRWRERSDPGREKRP